MRNTLRVAFLAWAALTPALRAELRFTQPVVNVGVVRTGTALAQRFSFVNAGARPVEITDAKTDCGCLVPKLDKRTFQPGEEGELRVEVNTLSQPAGPHTWTVHVRGTTDGVAFEMPLQLSAELLTEITVQPPLLAVFTNQAVSHEIRVTDQRPKALTVTAVRASSERLRPRVVDLCRDEKGRQVTKIRLDVSADYADGRHDEAIAIYTDDPAYPELRVPVTVVKRSKQRLAATPAEVTLVAAKGQPIPSRIVLIRDNEGQGVVVEKVAADDPAVVCKWAAGPDALATVKLAVDRGKLRGDTLQTNVHVYLSQPRPDVLTIPLRLALQ